tara:strand:- start:155 stop:796 length:642 start_codon:yes stop_codon:yes gene_type:complete
LLTAKLNSSGNLVKRENPPQSTSSLFLIDGYNLWWASEDLGPDNDTGTLEGARQSLINWLLATLTPKLAAKTVLVFDAKNPPANRTSIYNYQGLIVHFAVGYGEADTLMEEYIELHTSPRNLTVVSSDHRVQRAAKRRRAQAIDSNLWYQRINHEMKSKRAAQKTGHSKPNQTLSETEVTAWLQNFGLDQQGAGEALQAKIEEELKEKRRRQR